MSRYSEEGKALIDRHAEECNSQLTNDLKADLVELKALFSLIGKSTGSSSSERTFVTLLPKEIVEDLINWLRDSRRLIFPPLMEWIMMARSSIVRGFFGSIIHL